MKKTIIYSLVGVAVVGGYFLYTATRNAEDKASLLSIQGTSIDGVFQEMTFSNNGCVYSDESGRNFVGNTTTQEIEITCGIGDTEGVTAEQFSCAMNTCENNINFKSCANASATFASTPGSSQGTCTVSGCGDIDGSYTMTGTEFVQIQDSCGSAGNQYFDTCVANGCANTANTGTALEGIGSNLEQSEQATKDRTNIHKLLR